MSALDFTRTLIALPQSAARRSARALDDLATIARVAGELPDGLRSALARVDDLLASLDEVNTAARSLHADIARLDVVAQRLTAVGVAIHDGGEDLLSEMRILHTDTEGVRAVGLAIHDGGEDLLDAMREIDRRLVVFQAALPQLLSGVRTAQELGEQVESVAESIEPLQGAAETVGRVTRRLSRKTN